MEPINLSTREFWLYSLAINVGIGVVLGLIPLVVGFIKHQRKTAFLGFVVTIVGGAILGLLLAIPSAAIFTWLAVTRANKATDAPGSDSPAS